MPILMRRPTRTRRLSIASIVSLVAFVLLAGAEIRSFWRWDGLNVRNRTGFILSSGCVYVMHPTGRAPEGSFEHLHGDAGGPNPFGGILGFLVTNDLFHDPDAEKTFLLSVPLWFPLLLLLIAPVRWLIARPANAPAFPVVTDVEQSK